MRPRAHRRARRRQEPFLNHARREPVSEASIDRLPACSLPPASRSPELTMATHADLPQSSSSSSDASSRSGSRTATADTSRDGGLDHPGRGWRIAWGVLLIVSGVLAVLMPAVAALATAVVFAWLLVFAGVFEMAYSWRGRARRGFGWQLASGLLTLVL